MSESERAAAKQAFCEKVSGLIERSGMTQIEIARALGYENANIITMFKKGSTRVPPEKVVPLAHVLGQHPGTMLREWFVAYMPEVLSDIEAHLA
ncbi:helix-turn-helix domain-containing protein [Limobrevibacterium gyesilva]|uniref:Helix-turn-helix domain-containing protein n=1 Tax=Limobrevibacterium gyesilva TaxID=2991712 RepID=A0AA41YLV9_9PROT|nr:helix-turn-helix domain-containing protein [Limobrevibacterium gyesilva]MCW3476279.1 helix-turn-helix domain-containing protein [Limobrevibacterium gyesilva]